MSIQDLKSIIKASEQLLQGLGSTRLELPVSQAADLTAALELFPTPAKSTAYHGDLHRPEVPNILDSVLKGYVERLRGNCAKHFSEVGGRWLASVDELGLSRYDVERSLHEAFTQVYHRGLSQLYNAAVRAVQGRFEEDGICNGLPALARNVLEQAYTSSNNGSLSAKEALLLSQVTGLTMQQCRTWFSNRRARNKRKEREVKPLPGRAVKGLPRRAALSPVPSLSRSVSSSSESTIDSIDIGFNFEPPSLGVDVPKKIQWDVPDMSDVLAMLDQQLSEVVTPASDASWLTPVSDSTWAAPWATPMPTQPVQGQSAQFDIAQMLQSLQSMPLSTPTTMLAPLLATPQPQLQTPADPQQLQFDLFSSPIDMFAPAPLPTPQTTPSAQTELDLAQLFASFQQPVEMPAQPAQSTQPVPFAQPAQSNEQSQTEQSLPSQPWFAPAALDIPLPEGTEIPSFDFSLPCLDFTAETSLPDQTIDWMNNVLPFDSDMVEMTVPLDDCMGMDWEL